MPRSTLPASRLLAPRPRARTGAPRSAWLAVALALAGTPALAHASERPIVVDGPRVALGDLSPTAPRELAGIDVAAAPAPGHSARITRVAVREALTRAGVDPRYADGLPAHREVQRASARVEPDALAQEVAALAAAELPIGVTVTRVEGVRGLELPLGERRLELRLSRLRSVTQASLRVLVDDRPVASLPLALHLDGQAEVPRLRRDLPRGATIAAGDVELQTVELERLPPNATLRPEELVGRALTQPGRAGAAVQRAAVVAPALVRRGGAVTVVAVGAGLRITQSGVAQHDAKLGESVRVTAPSGQVIQGLVVAAGTVHVQLGGGAP